MVKNPLYSGPDKPYLNELDFVPYTSSTAEDAALKAGSTGANALDIGYLDQSDTPQLQQEQPGRGQPAQEQGLLLRPAERARRHRLLRDELREHRHGPLFKQPYFMKAIQDTVDQAGQSAKIGKGWWTPDPGAIPAGVGNVSSPGQVSAETFDQRRQGVLKAHGWDTATTPATCADPGTGANQCGAGITAGEKAEYTLDYPSGETAVQLQAEDMASDAAQAGIKIDINPKTQNAVGSEDAVCAGSTKAGGCWQAIFYGGWVYAPQVDPTGEPLFATGAGANTESYSNIPLDKLIYQTTISNSASTMDDYENLLSQDQPVIYVPNAYENTGQADIPEVINGLFVGQSDPFQGFEPQFWYYTKSTS
jgi:peptide/nickel transport system substrate-binding protein